MAGFSQTSKTYTEEFPKHLVSLKMTMLPDGTIESGGKTHGIKNLAISTTEIPWEVFEIWALRMDQTTEEQTTGVDATSRPSKPYAAIFIGFGHHGHPAICMSYHAVELYCEWLSKTTGKKYRLPTAAEWEYAAHGGAKELPDLDAAAWFWDNADDATHPVGTKTANGFGLHDMLGNAAEWVIGTDGKPAVMGGSWKTKKADFSFSAQTPFDPNWNMSDPQNPKSKWWLANGQMIGFRVVCEGPF